MSKGGARNRSGPQPDPESFTSTRRGLKFDALDPVGFSGEVPAFPLPKCRILRWVFDDKRKWQELDADATERFADREVELWEWAWRTPQACAWSMPSEQWRIRTVALWCRTSVRCEAKDASAANLAQLHRFADQIGLTTAGLAEMGWKVQVDEVAQRRAEPEADPAPRSRRLRAAGDG